MALDGDSENVIDYTEDTVLSNELSGMAVRCGIPAPSLARSVVSESWYFLHLPTSSELLWTQRRFLQDQ